MPRGFRLFGVLMAAMCHTRCVNPGCDAAFKYRCHILGWLPVKVRAAQQAELQPIALGRDGMRSN